MKFSGKERGTKITPEGTVQLMATDGVVTIKEVFLSEIVTVGNNKRQMIKVGMLCGKPFSDCYLFNQFDYDERKDPWALHNAMRTTGVINDISEGDSYDMDDDEVLSRVNKMKGLALVENEMYEGKERTQFKYFVSKDDAGDLPKAEPREGESEEEMPEL